MAGCTNEVRTVEESTEDGVVDTRTTGCVNSRDVEPRNKVVVGNVDDTCFRTGRSCRSNGTTPGKCTLRIANLDAECDEVGHEFVVEVKNASAAGVGFVGTEVVHTVVKCGYNAASADK